MLEDIQRFLDGSNYTDATITSYRYALQRLSGWLDDRGLRIDNFDVSLFNSFLREHKWSNNMRRLYGNAIKSFLRWRYGPTQPALALKLPRDNARPGRSLDIAQVENLITSFDTSTAQGWRNLAMLSLMIESGLRASEICNLEIRYLDLVKFQFTVIAKRQKWRKGIFSQNTALYLDMWLSARKKVAAPDCSYVFVGILGSTPGHKMTPAGLRANFRKYGIRSEVGTLSPHDLRRTMATLLIEAGAPTRLVQELGAWDDIRMVERYTQNLKTQDIEKYSPVVRALSIKLCR